MTQVIRATILFAFGLAAATPAQAITFATGQGTDSAGCGAVVSPCRTLHQAVANTPAGGYVVLQGQADFGPTFINKSISVVGENGATIRATTASEGPVPIEIRGGAPDFASPIVRVRGLTIEGAGVGKAGIVYLGGARMEISNCVIVNSSVTGSWRTVVGPLIDKGASATGSATGVTDSVANYNGDLVLRNSIVSTGGTALRANGESVIHLSHSTITGNARVFEGSAGVGALFTYGGNVIRGNADDTLSRFSPQPLH